MQNYHHFTIYNNTNVDYNNTNVEKHLKHASALISTSAGFESVGNDAKLPSARLHRGKRPAPHC